MAEKICKPNQKKLRELLKNATFKDEIKIFKLLANPIRLKIAYLLSKQELCTCDLEQILDKDQTLISHYMRPFKDLDLISERQEGKWRYYSVKDERIKKIFDTLSV